jgi:hypothetical protein
MRLKQYQTAVNQIEILLHRMKLSREEILCVLAKVTANAIHVIEERALRTRVELGSVEIWDSARLDIVIQAWDGPICAERCPVGENGTALPG